MRDCGECTECCTAMAVSQLSKAAGEPCEHCTGAGCGQYDSRPSQCRAFSCMWLNGTGKERDRPDRSGMIFAKPQSATVFGSNEPTAMAYEASDGAAKRAAGADAISRLAESGRVILMKRDAVLSVYTVHEIFGI